jgi:hypothetical protein
MGLDPSLEGTWQGCIQQTKCGEINNRKRKRNTTNWSDQEKNMECEKAKRRRGLKRWIQHSGFGLYRQSSSHQQGRLVEE